VFDDSCSNCHTTGNPGGLDNSSFCSNSACHGSAWEYAGFDAPSLRELLKDQLTAIAPVEAPSVPAKADETPTYTEIIGGLLGDRCGACHGEGALAGLNLTTYSTLMAGGQDGAVIVPGNAEGSLLVQVQREASPHFAQLTPQELSLVERWINTGAPE
jgi:mono/diheme cytochrome c family protein